MEGNKINLFFVGRNRFNYYIIDPLNALISIVNTGINNSSWNKENAELSLPISILYSNSVINRLWKIILINNKYKDNFKIETIKQIERISVFDILYLTFEDVKENKELQYKFKFNNDIDINNLIRLKSNIKTDLINDDGNTYEQNMDIVIPISIFEYIFKTHSKIDKSKLPITCYFAITPELTSELTNEIDIKNSKDFGSIFNQLLNNNNNKLNYIFMSDVKQCHQFVGYFLSPVCSRQIKNDDEDDDDDDENNIIKFFNDIYVLPCLHDIKDKAGTISSYFDMKTDCRNNPTKNENYKDNKLLNDYTQDVSKKRKNDCTNIGIECDVNITIQHYNINWTIYNDFYADGYRDQNIRGRRLCRENNFLGIFFDNFVAEVNAHRIEVNAHRIEGKGGKKYKKTKKLRRSRKYRKHKSRKYKNN